MSFTKIDDYDLYALLYAGDENSENTSEESEQPKQNSTNMNIIYIGLGVVALVDIGVLGFVLTKKKSSGKKATSIEYDEDENEIVEDDGMNFYDNQDDEE